MQKIIINSDFFKDNLIILWLTKHKIDNIYPLNKLTILIHIKFDLLIFKINRSYQSVIKDTYYIVID